ncbi:heterokaryon incompatibility protein Het-C-domain-containing protein [Aspergillus egyptiacus]|nr:heterokaryon incompatibility protein Het-C-domain-containing protein [Aspergillus egyptiacus]
MIKRVYFGNWLRDYSQAMDVGTLKGLPADTIRILVWILSFLSFGYATGEYEVTAERLGVYRPEEHIDNPKDYADNEDARLYDARLRGPIRQIELEIDPETGMKNYIANEKGDWATSAGYVRYSLAHCIHYGRLYTSGGGRKGKEEDLCEALRYLGQALHTLEDFAAHTNYIELALREMGFRNVFPHTGTQTQMDIRGERAYPLVTGTFGMVDFFHSVLGEATDHFTQSEINEMDSALGDAQSSSSANSLNALTSLLQKVPGCSDLATEAETLEHSSEAQQASNNSRGTRTGYAFQELTRSLADDSERSRGYEQSRASPPPTDGKPTGLPGMPDFNPAETVAKIYPILEFRDKVVRKVSSIIEKIPGLEALFEKISETLTVFVMSLLAPFIRPIINAASQSLHAGSAAVIDSSGKHQYEPWTNPHCTDPTHSMLSKDHFSNILNEPAGHVASAIVKYVVPRVIRAWDDLDTPDDQVLRACLMVFHHPALRNPRNEAHRNMYEAVESWVNVMPDRGAKLNDILSAEGVKSGLNNGGVVGHSHAEPHTGFPALGGTSLGHSHGPHPPYQKPQLNTATPPPQNSNSGSGSGSQLPWDKLSGQLGSLPIPPGIPGMSAIDKLGSKLSSFGLGGSSSTREKDDSGSPQPQPQPQPQYQYDQHSQPQHHPTPPPLHHQGYASHTLPPPHHQPGGYGAPSYGNYSHPPPPQHQPYDYGHGHGHHQPDPGYGQPPPPFHDYGYSHGHQPPYPGQYGHEQGHGPGYPPGQGYGHGGHDGHDGHGGNGNGGYGGYGY